jgi:hypothetical protein
MNRLDKLNDDKYMKDNLKNEVMRSNAVTNSALAYIKIKNLELKIKNLSHIEREAFKKVSE